MAEGQGRARVTSVDALERFRPSLVAFVEEAQLALGSCSSDAGRALEWIRRDRLPHWKRELRLREEKLTRAKGDVIKKASTPTPTGAPPSTVEERKAAAKAQRAVDEAKQKLELCQSWQRRLERALEEYKGATQQLAGMLAGDLQDALHALDRMSAALEGYVTVTPDQRAGERRRANERRSALEAALKAAQEDEGQP